MFKHVQSDLRSGIVVFLVALPLCLGIAFLQKAPPISGVVSAIVGGIIVGLYSKSRFSVSGPDAGLTTAVLAALSNLGSFEAFLYCLIIAGIMQVILGALKAGIMGHYIPSAVIKGILAAIGIILVTKQIPHLVGYDRDAEGDEGFIQNDGENTLSELTHIFTAFNPACVIIGFSSLLILLLWQSKYLKKIKFLQLIPAALLVVVIGSLIHGFLSKYFLGNYLNSEHLVDLPEIHSPLDFFNSLSQPDFSVWKKPEVYLQAFLLSIVLCIDTLLNIEAVDKLDPENYITPTNRELIGQGIGNMLCGFFGGIPISSVIVRSSANINSGAKTKLSTIIHGTLFFLLVAFVPNILELIPKSALAAILIFTGFRLTSPRLYRTVYRQGLDQFLPFITTVITFYFTDLLVGVSCGIIVSVFFILRQNYRNPYKLVEDEINGQKHLFIKLSQNVTFLNKGKLIELLHGISPGTKVFIDGGRTNFIDKDVLEVISEFKRSAPYNNIELVLEEIQEVELLS